MDKIAKKGGVKSGFGMFLPTALPANINPVNLVNPVKKNQSLDSG